MPATSHRFPPNQLQVERLPILRQESTIWSPEPSVVFQFGSQIAEIIDKVWYDKSPVPFGGVSDRDLPKRGKHLKTWDERLQCLSAVSQIETNPIRVQSSTGKDVSSAFRRCLRSRLKKPRLYGAERRQVSSAFRRCLRSRRPSSRKAWTWKPKVSSAFRRCLRSRLTGGLSTPSKMPWSPVPFGGVSDRDLAQFDAIQARTDGVSSAFRRCLRSRLYTEATNQGPGARSPVPFGGVSDRDKPTAR